MAEFFVEIVDKDEIARLLYERLESAFDKTMKPSVYEYQSMRKMIISLCEHLVDTDSSV